MRLLEVDPGYRTSGVLTARVSLPRVKYADDARRTRFYDELTARVRAMPEVRAAGMVSIVPLGGGPPELSFSIAGAPPAQANVVQDAGVFTVTPGYFRALDIPLLSGRLIGTGDVAGAPGVTVISEAMAHRYWKGQDPIGSRITFGDPADSSTAWFTVVGIVAGVRNLGLAEPPKPQLYLPMAQSPSRSMVLVARVTGEPTRIVTAAQGDTWPARSGRRRSPVSGRCRSESPIPSRGPRLSALAARSLRRHRATPRRGGHLRRDRLRSNAADARARHPPRPRRRTRIVLRMVLRQGMTPVVAGRASARSRAAGAAACRGAALRRRGTGSRDLRGRRAVPSCRGAGRRRPTRTARRALRSHDGASSRVTPEVFASPSARCDGARRSTVAVVAHAGPLHRRHDRRVQRGLRRAVPAAAVRRSRGGLLWCTRSMTGMPGSMSVGQLGRHTEDSLCSDLVTMSAASVNLAGTTCRRT